MTGVHSPWGDAQHLGVCDPGEHCGVAPSKAAGARDDEAGVATARRRSEVSGEAHTGEAKPEGERGTILPQASKLKALGCIP
mmetsp:Transcript_152735/g.489935  ORF Transcript_152735/g.489935 Transcript_152735/m.489935 type:complete len:82 (+) Transcript_152735:616-861(+)